MIQIRTDKASSKLFKRSSDRSRINPVHPEGPLSWALVIDEWRLR
jgi:hypothetical protein